LEVEKEMLMEKDSETKESTLEIMIEDGVLPVERIVK